MSASAAATVTPEASPPRAEPEADLPEAGRAPIDGSSRGGAEAIPRHVPGEAAPEGVEHGRGPDLTERGAELFTAAAERTARTVERAGAGVAQLRSEERAVWKDTASRAELPEIGLGEDPLRELAVRADREADFFRTMAVRQLQPGPGRLLAALSALVALLAGTALGAAAGLRAFFGAGLGDAAGSEAAALALVLGVGALVGGLLEREARARAEAALARAALAERRIERLAAILAVRTLAPSRFADAVARLEREPTR
jgi:hypothetical protein